MNRNLLFSLFAFLIVPLLFACGAGQSKQEAIENPVVIESLHIEQKSGPDCDKPDSLQLYCSIVNLYYPSVKSGGEVLKKAVETWSGDFMTSLIGYAGEPDNMPTLEEAIKNFFDSHDEVAKDFPEVPAYAAETKDTILLNDGKHLTLRISGYSYAGGAHPNSTTTVATWETATGNPVKVEDVVTDLKALQNVAEKKFREVRKEAFQEGFDFDETFVFKLADNIGMVKDGLYFCYVPYEVGPYVLGQTEFVIPFDEIRQILK